VQLKRIKIELSSGDIMYVTDILPDDLRVSIYPTRAIYATKEKVEAVERIYPNLVLHLEPVKA